MTGVTVGIRGRIAAGVVATGLVFASAPAFAQTNNFRGFVIVKSVKNQFSVHDPVADGKPVRGQYRFTKTSGPAHGTLDNRSGATTTVTVNTGNTIHAHRGCLIDPGVQILCSGWWTF
jgi:hypothetical protein